MTRPTPTDLRSDPAYRLMLALPHKDLAPFIRTFYFQRITWIITAQYAFITVLLIAWLLWGVQARYIGEEWLAHFGLAIMLFAMLIPIHEAVHALMYRLMGAQTVHMKASLRQLYIVAVAPDFVIDGSRFAWVAITPFVAITVVLALGMILLPSQRHVLVAVMLLHTGGASGDFALLSYLWLHRQHDVLTYDDAEAQISYFYQRVNP